MVGPFLCLIYLLTYSDNERALHGSPAWQHSTVWCQWFGVNMGFSDKYRILMENMYIFKDYRAKTHLLKISE